MTSHDQVTVRPVRSQLDPLLAIWAAISGSVGLLGVLLLFGLDGGLWSAAGAVLLMSCVGVCTWAVAQGRATDREVRRAVTRLVAARQADVAETGRDRSIGR